MNIERMLKVKERIARPELRFDMSNYDFCIAGHASDMARAEGLYLDRSSIPQRAAAYLKLTQPEYMMAFSRTDLDRKGAMAMIDKMIEAERLWRESQAAVPVEAPSPEEVKEEELCLV